MSPSETFSSKPVPSQKKDKTRVTVILGVNATGTDKLKPWVIGNLKRLRPLSKVNLERLPVYYRGNPKAWMNSLVFEKVLCEMDRRFKIQDKKILLLIDNALSHFDSHYLPALEIEQNDDDNASNENQTFRGCDGRVGGSRGRSGHSGDSYHDESGGYQLDISWIQLTHVEVVFLPSNTTSHLQPLDAGIIASFKNYFKRKFCRHMLDLFEEDRDDASRIQQEMMDSETADVNQMIEELDMNDPSAALLANELNNFFQELEEIQTEDILSDADIIRLVQEDARDEDESSDSKDDTLVSPGDTSKSLEIWISFYEQQDDNEFHAEDLKLFKRYFKIIKRLE
ncbi:tigger transposable element-derived protein 4-like [Rhizophagus irregularis DAOM 181602=DAOM 197198]|nr:tigger transposable element-derived protein 4-like [Rhizophagus irregularis DAOM 181602=DAOM 197198]